MTNLSNFISQLLDFLTWQTQTYGGGMGVVSRKIPRRDDEEQSVNDA
jgi:hypothetical protein